MTDQNKDIIIANPMYDAVFKSLMQDKSNAQFFVGTILGERILDIEFAPQEYIREKQSDTETEKQIETLKPIHLDFVITIRTRGGGKKKVLIEIQQSLNPIDAFRFRSYLAKQYAAHENIIKREKIVVKKDKVTIKEEILNLRSIIAIYILGFEIEDAPHIVFKQSPQGVDIVDGGEVHTQHPIVKDLAHESYYVQVPRIKAGRYSDWSKCSRLLKLLSLFEQNYFVDKSYLKKYIYPINSITDKSLEKMINRLIEIAADPYTRRVMEEEAFAAMNIDFWKQTIVDKDVIIAKKDDTIVALQHQLEKYQRRYGKLNGF